MSYESPVRFGKYVVMRVPGGEWSAFFMAGVRTVDLSWRGGITVRFGNSFTTADAGKKACEDHWREVITEEYEKLKNENDEEVS